MDFTRRSFFKALVASAAATGAIPIGLGKVIEFNEDEVVWTTVESQPIDLDEIEWMLQVYNSKHGWEDVPGVLAEDERGYHVTFKPKDVFNQIEDGDEINFHIRGHIEGPF